MYHEECLCIVIAVADISMPALGRVGSHSMRGRNVHVIVCSYTQRTMHQHRLALELIEDCTYTLGGYEQFILW